MPTRPLTHLQRIGRHKTYRDTYEEKRKNDPDLFKAKRIRSSGRWQRVRSFFLKRNPLCNDPFGLHKNMHQVIAAREVHHIISLVVDPTKAFDMDNLQALCTACHSRVENTVGGGLNL